MLTTLVEEFDTSAVFQVSTHSCFENEENTRIHDDVTADRKHFDERSGSICIEELQVSILWWTCTSDALTPSGDSSHHLSDSPVVSHDAQRSYVRARASSTQDGLCLINLMAVSESNNECALPHTSSQMLSVPIPASSLAEGILTCGVVRQSVHKNTVVVTWLTHALKATYIPITFQRQSSAAGTIFFTVEGAQMTSQPMTTIYDLFDTHSDNSNLQPHGHERIGQPATGNNTTTATVAADRRYTASPSSSPTHVRSRRLRALLACVLSEIASNEEISVVAVFVLTDGITLCSARVHTDGSFAAQHVILPDGTNSSSNYSACRDEVASVCGALLGNVPITLDHAPLSSSTRGDAAFASAGNQSASTNNSSDHKRYNSNDEDRVRTCYDEHAHELTPAIVEVSRIMDHVPRASRITDDTDRYQPSNNHKHNNAAHSDSGDEGGTHGSWISRWFRLCRQGQHVSPSGATADVPSNTSGQSRGRYLAIHAVQNMPYVALQRSNGLLEFYTSTWTLVHDTPTLFLPLNQLTQHQCRRSDGHARANHVESQVVITQQHVSWSKQGRCVHVVTVASCRGSRRCYWSLLPLRGSSDATRTNQTHPHDARMTCRDNKTRPHRHPDMAREATTTFLSSRTAVGVGGANTAHAQDDSSYNNITNTGDVSNDNNMDTNPIHDAFDTNERIALRCTYALSAPTPNATPRCCVVSAARGELLILWSNTGTEHQSLCTLDNLSLLTQLATAAPSVAARVNRSAVAAQEEEKALVHIVQAESAHDGRMLWRGTDAFLCRGTQAARKTRAQYNGPTVWTALTRGSSFAIIEHSRGGYRVYQVHRACHALERVMASLCAQRAPDAPFYMDQDEQADEADTDGVDHAERAARAEDTALAHAATTCLNTRARVCVSPMRVDAAEESEMWSNAHAVALPLPALHLIPLYGDMRVDVCSLKHTTGTQRGVGGRVGLSECAERVFYRGLTGLFVNTPYGALLLTQLLRGVLSCGQTTSLLAVALPRILSEMAMHTDTTKADDGARAGEQWGRWSDAAADVDAHSCMRAALQTALRTDCDHREHDEAHSAHTSVHGGTRHAKRAACARTGCAPGWGCTRHAVLHTVARRLQSRIGYLTVCYLGWASLAEGVLTECDELARSVALAIQLLTAAYHTVCVAGLELTALAAHTRRSHRDGGQQGSRGGDEGATDNRDPDGGRGCPPWYAMEEELLIPPFRQLTEETEMTRFVVRLAHALMYECGSSGLCARSCMTWCHLLRDRFPVLQHFILLHHFHYGYTTQGATMMHMCVSICESLAALPAASQRRTCRANHQGDDAAAAPAVNGERSDTWRCRTLCDLLMDYDMLLLLGPRVTAGDGGAAALSRTSDNSALRDEVRQLLSAPSLSQQRAHVPPSTPCTQQNRIRGSGADEASWWVTKLYAVGVLRRAVAVETATVHLGLPATVLENYLLVELLLLLQSLPTHPSHAVNYSRIDSAVEDAVADSTKPDAYALLRRALNTLYLDVCLALAHTHSEPERVGICFHYLHDALGLAQSLHLTALCAPHLRCIVANLVNSACGSTVGMNCLLRVAISNARLEEMLLMRWYAFITRLPTARLTNAPLEDTRYWAILGIQHYLMSRHAYAQCAGVLANLACMLRCTPLHRSRMMRLTIAQLAAMALSAAEMIYEENDYGLDGTVAAVATAGMRVCEGETSCSSHVEHSDANHDMQGAASLAQTTPHVRHVYQTHRRGDLIEPAESTPLRDTSHGAPPDTVTDAMDSAAPDEGALSPPATAPLPVLTRADIPRLRRLVFQARCEERLWQSGGTLDAVEAWMTTTHSAVTGTRCSSNGGISNPTELAPVCASTTMTATKQGVRRIVNALMQVQLWYEAYRLSILSELDACVVLQAWATYLIEHREDHGELVLYRDRPYSSGHRHDDQESYASMLRTLPHATNYGKRWRDEWSSLTAACAESSNSANHFAGYRCTLLAALTLNYRAVPAMLPRAHRDAAPYSAMTTLLGVFHALSQRLCPRDVCTADEEERQTPEKADAPTAIYGDEICDNTHGDSSGSCDNTNNDNDVGGMASRADARRKGGDAGGDGGEETLIHAWLAWADASRIVIELLSDAAASADTSERVANANKQTVTRLDDASACMTAGLIDHLVRHGKEILQTPTLLHRLRDTYIEETARKLVSMM